MEIDKFINDFADLFEDTDVTLFSEKTSFKDVLEWDSLLLLSTIAMIDEKYGISIKGSDLEKLVTILDLFQFIKKRI